jgi:tetratricopeptide (TPR) repeat protein
MTKGVIAKLSSFAGISTQTKTALMAMSLAFRSLALSGLIAAACLLRAQEPTTVTVVDADKLYYAGDCKAAIVAYRAILARRPGDGTSALQLGDCDEKLGQVEQAVASYQRASKDSLVAGEAFHALARLKASAGDVPNAIALVNKAIDSGFDDSRALLREKQFAGLLQDPRAFATLRRLFGPGFTGFTTDPNIADKRKGLQVLHDAIRNRVPDAYRAFSPAQWDAALASGLARVESGNLDDYFFELTTLAGMAADVHTLVFVPRSPSLVLNRAYPLRFWKFSDGLYVRAAAPPLANFVGAKILAIGGIPMEQAWKKMLDRLPAENEWDSVGWAQFFMQFPGFLHATSIANDAQVTWTIQRQDERPVTERFDATDPGGWQLINSSNGIVAPDGYREGHDTKNPPLWLKNRYRKYWFEYLSDSNSIFVQVNEPRDDPQYPWSDFLQEVFQTIHEKHATRLIIDLRHNGGGYGYLAQSLVHKIIATPEIDQPGRLFVLIGRVTQSAGVVFASKLELETHAVFLGEPLAGHPNSFNSPMGMHVAQALPGTDIMFRVSSRLQQFSDHQDDRRFIAPDISIGMSYADYGTGKDPTLDTALTTTPEQVQLYFQDETGRPLPLYMRWRRPNQKPAFIEHQWARLKR